MTDVLIYSGVLIWLGGCLGILSIVSDNSALSWRTQILVVFVHVIIWSLLLMLMMGMSEDG